MLKELKGIHSIHFVGIGGAGMSPLAKILLLLGYQVSGSDQGSSPIIEELVRLGARVWTDGQRAENVRGADAIVVSTAIPYDNPEVIAAWDLRIPKLHRSDINAALVNEYDGIAVAGSHGKTTTTSMIGVTLDRVGVSPTIIVGGEVPDLGTNAKLGTGRYLVSEADESDGSFLKLRPHITERWRRSSRRSVHSLIKWMRTVRQFSALKMRSCAKLRLRRRAALFPTRSMRRRIIVRRTLRRMGP